MKSHQGRSGETGGPDDRPGQPRGVGRPDRDLRHRRQRPVQLPAVQDPRLVLGPGDGRAAPGRGCASRSTATTRTRRAQPACRLPPRAPLAADLLRGTRPGMPAGSAPSSAPARACRPRPLARPARTRYRSVVTASSSARAPARRWRPTPWPCRESLSELGRSAPAPATARLRQAERAPGNGDLPAATAVGAVQRSPTRASPRSAAPSVRRVVMRVDFDQLHLRCVFRPRRTILPRAPASPGSGPSAPPASCPFASQSLLP